MRKTNDPLVVKQQYAAANNLETRLSIHDKYSTNKQGFGNWIFSNYRIDTGDSVLELGCGTGAMWKNRESLLRACSKVVLSDLSEGMVAAAKDTVGSHDAVEYRVIDIQAIPYEDASFDVVIANMMLYHVPDLDKALAEVRRVLKRGGRFYCATYGEDGILAYLSKILSAYGVADTTNKTFTLQNGAAILGRTFSTVEKREYIDSLAVTHIDDMVEYIYSLSSMMPLRTVPRQIVKEILMENAADGVLRVPKEYGMFLAS